MVAAGSSRRMDGIDKIFYEVSGMPLIAHTIAAFQRPGLIESTVLVLPSSNLSRGRELVEQYGYKNVTICPGGDTRQQSVANGLAAVGACDMVLVHDGDRPLVSATTIETGIRLASRSGIAIPVVPVNDTIKEVSPAGYVVRTIERANVAAVHTPQVFRYEILKQIHRQADAAATDDSVLAERLGHEIITYPDSPENLKVTTRIDLLLANAILDQRRLHGTVPAIAQKADH